MRRAARSLIILIMVLCLASCNENVGAGEAVPVADGQSVSSNDVVYTPVVPGNVPSGVSDNESGSELPDDETVTVVAPAEVKKPESSSLSDPFNGVGGVSVTAEHYSEPAACVNVKNCGAVGDGVTDDFAAVSAGVAMAGASGLPLYFPAGTYYLSQRLVLNQNITIIGESMDSVGIVFKNDAPFSPVEQYNQRGMVTFVADLLDAKGVTFCYYAESYSGYTRQSDGSGGGEGALFSILNGSSISFYNCRFLVEEKDQPSVTCLWIKSEVHNIGNIKITACDICNKSASTVGGGIWISAHDSSETFLDNVEISKSSFYQRGNDELLAVWGYHISNVSVHDNGFVFEGHSTQNDVLISFGSPKEGRAECLKNIKFYNNSVKETGLIARVLAVQLLTPDSDVEISGNRIMCYPDASSEVKIFRLTDPGSTVVKNNSVGVDGGSRADYVVYSFGKVRFSGNLFKTRNTGFTGLIRISQSAFYTGVDIRFEKEVYDLGANNATSGKAVIQIPVGGSMVYDTCTFITTASAIHETKIQLLYAEDSGYGYPANSLDFVNSYIDTTLLIGFSKPSNTSVRLNNSYVSGISFYTEGSGTGPATLEMAGTQYASLKYNWNDVTLTEMAGCCQVITQ